MRLVVGPLPASVYWRRRAMVLGGAILAVLLITYSCSQGGKSPAAGPSPGPSASSSPAAEVTPSAEASPPPGEVTTPVTQVSPTAQPVLPVGDPALCTDAELSVTAQPLRNPLAAGTEVQINLLIKNISSRECVRGVGADVQELYIVLGTEKIWSSDHCGALTGTDVRTFPPAHERSYRATWNGKSSVSCEAKNPSGPVPAKGDYQLFGRVGTDLSEPLVLKLT
jgi:hypothetical protein